MSSVFNSAKYIDGLRMVQRFNITLLVGYSTDLLMYEEVLIALLVSKPCCKFFY